MVFICPKNRIISLWGELLRLCPQHDYQLEDELREPKYTKVDGLSMAIVSWISVIDILRQALSTEHSSLLNDLIQLQGLCELMDENSFLPFVQEDFGVDRARRITSYYNIVDRVAEELINKLHASMKGLKATPQYAGYSRYLTLGNYGIAILFNCRNWESYAETPFWLEIREIENNKWVFAINARNKLSDYENRIPKLLFANEKLGALLFPLFAPAYKTENEVIKNLIEQIEKVYHRLDSGVISTVVNMEEQ